MREFSPDADAAYKLPGSLLAQLEEGNVGVGSERPSGKCLENKVTTG